MMKTLGLRYATSRDQLRFLLGALRELLHAHPKTIRTPDDPVRARFGGYGSYSLDIEVRVYIHTAGNQAFPAIQEDKLLRVSEIVERSGTGFAFQSRTFYPDRDAGLDKEQRMNAETQVREWSSEHSLLFPDIAEDQRKKIRDTLDFPRDGSPGSES